MHRQFMLVLLFQLLAPLVLIIVPLAMVIVNGVLGLPSLFTLTFLVTTNVYLIVTLHALINALMTIAVVAPYRRYTWKLLRSIFFCHSGGN